jgi:probable rRNA maturation factor
VALPESGVKFSLTQTPPARKVFSISSELRAKMKHAALLVVETELPGIRLDLSVVAMSDEELLEINRASLTHDYLTDVITFEIERTEDSLESEIYISVERALENAKRFKRAIDLEIIHLVIHAVLHLAGHTDKTSSGRKQMRTRERWYLAALSK